MDAVDWDSMNDDERQEAIDLLAASCAFMVDQLGGTVSISASDLESFTEANSNGGGLYVEPPTDERGTYRFMFRPAPNPENN